MEREEIEKRITEIQRELQEKHNLIDKYKNKSSQLEDVMNEGDIPDVASTYLEKAINETDNVIDSIQGEAEQLEEEKEDLGDDLEKKEEE